MRTRNSYFPNKSSVTIPRRRNKRRTPNVVEPELRTIVEIAPMADNRIMEDLLQAPIEGYGEAIVISEINADHFEIKTNLLQLVQANPYHGFKRENSHTHINNFKSITLTLKFRDVSNDVSKLMMFPYSLEGSARVWYDKEPPNSILTWENLVNKFVNLFFPPSKTTHLKNKISRFTQIFEETFREAWERFKEMLRACPHHGFTELTQIDTLYNGLNENDQDYLNAATGGNLLSKTTREALQIIENKSKVRYSRNKPNFSRINTTSRENASKSDDRIDKLADQISTLVYIFAKKVVTPATVKAVEESCVTCGGNHAYYNCDTTNSNQSSVCAATGVSFRTSLKLSHLFYTDDVVFWGNGEEIVNKLLCRLSKWKIKTLSIGGRVIKVIHGEESKLGNPPKSYCWSTWIDIVRETVLLNRQRIDVLEFIKKKVCNGVDTYFWEDVWKGEVLFKSLHPRVYALESCKHISISAKLAHDNMGVSLRRIPKGGADHDQFLVMSTNVEGFNLPTMQDRWVWSLTGAEGFSVASARSHIDDQ
uniref:Reverse transcriptase domain-containing protein n=1 Tax=Tanacetum cinerariifolium TaxID=118510 RepID=A0A6L2P420_TANCI|nr:reverse transcriptase domain-containing protein [Tanacetum cinerariifolium]